MLGANAAEAGLSVATAPMRECSIAFRKGDHTVRTYGAGLVIAMPSRLFISRFAAT